MQLVKWIKIEEQLPESGQEVLSYYYDEAGFHQTDIVKYFNEGDIIEYHVDFSIKDPTDRLLHALSPDSDIKATESGFYLIINGHMQKHSDIITHWMPLPHPPVTHEFLVEVVKRFILKHGIKAVVKGCDYCDDGCSISLLGGYGCYVQIKDNTLYKDSQPYCTIEELLGKEG